MRRRSREQGAGAERAGSVSEEQAARERAARAGSSGSRSREQGAGAGAGSRSVRSSAMRAHNRGYYYVSSCALSSRASSTSPRHFRM